MRRGMTRDAYFRLLAQYHSGHPAAAISEASFNDTDLRRVNELGSPG